MVRLARGSDKINSEVEGNTSTREKEMRDMGMYVCGVCVVFKLNGDYSDTGWSASRVEEIAENLKDYEVLIEKGPRFVMDHCSGCGVRGGDMYRARYYDEAN